jgi:hypothetical protein
LDFCRVGLDLSVRHQVVEYLPLAGSKDTLFGVEPKSCIPHISEGFGEVGQVILFIFARDDNVVHVDENVAAYLTFEDLFVRRKKVDPAFLSPSGILMKQYVPERELGLHLVPK